MRSRLGWVLGGVAVAAAFVRRRARRRPPRQTDPAPAAAAGDPRAAELRERLAQAREVAADRDAFEEGETTIDAAPDPDERRREVHERGRAAIDEMRPGD